MLDAYGKLPIAFVENQGQTDAGVAYYLHARGHSVYFSASGHALRLTQGHGEQARAHVVKVDLVDAKAGTIQGGNRTAGSVSYFRGARSEWLSALPMFSTIRYREPWPGIALDYRSTGGKLESVYTVAPHADPARIQLRYSGQQSLRIDAVGNLVYDTSVGPVQESAPVVYQEIAGERIMVAATYTLRDANTVAFDVAAYDREHALVIDPTLTYSGFIGGFGDDEGFDVDIDSAGNAYVVGYSSSTETTFPVLVGPDLTHNAGTTDAFIAKVNADGTALVYAGYIGGNGPDIARGVAVDAAGNAYITGYCTSGPTTFPVLVGPDLTYNGGSYDAWVAKVNPEGTALLYAGYIGGSGSDLAFAIDIDADGNAYVAGNTDSSSATFPEVIGPDQGSNGGQDGFVAKVSADGATLVYAGFIGGSGLDRANAIAVDGQGFAYVTGPTDSTAATFPELVGPDLTENGLDDAYVAKISADGSALIYAGYIGGSGNDRGNGIAVDSLGNAYVTGSAASTEATFPVLEGPDLTHNGGEDAFITKVSADGATLIYSGYIGGSSTDSGNAVAVNAAGAAYVAGSTFSTQASFPVLEGPDLTHNGATDIFVAKVNVAGTALNYAGYLGGNGGDPGRGIAVDNDGNAFVTGTAASSGGSFPVVVGPDLSFNGYIDAFVSRVTEPSDTVFRDGFE
ncbi:MAG: SBBP repeat-containing protein [Rhodanobacteraceae bacterium]|nr:SBBP repeat-containing protein [Rhodanobacteraceae bacterium]MBP9155485.1 SBBP repeat-containing protein [Xanthomonadales bacterium]